jgi:hypothetical protein
MSLVALTAPLIRLAAIDDRYAQDLFDAVDTNESSKTGLVNDLIETGDLARLTITEWHWYANWRQALGGGLDPNLLPYLTETGTTRFARFEVRALVLRDPRTNELARDPRTDELARQRTEELARQHPDELARELTPEPEPELQRRPNGDRTDALGWHWLSDQARGERVEVVMQPASYRSAQDYYQREDRARRAPDDKSLQEDARRPMFSDEYYERRRRAYNEDALELMTDALQCATDASWFLLRQLASPDNQPSSPLANQRRELVMNGLAAFAEQRGLNRRWYELDQPLRNE